MQEKDQWRSASIDCKTVYAINGEPPGDYACYSRYKFVPGSKITNYFRIAKGAVISQEAIEWFKNELILNMVADEYLKVTTIEDLTLKEWKETAKIVNRNGWSVIGFDYEVPIWKVVSKQPKTTHRQGWFAFFTFLREIQEYPQIVEAAFRASKTGLTPSESWVAASLFQTHGGHTALYNAWIDIKDTADKAKKYSLADCFSKIHKEGPNLNVGFGMTDKPISYLNVYTKIQTDKWLKEFCSRAWNDTTIKYLTRIYQ